MWTTWNPRLYARPAQGTSIRPLHESPYDGAQPRESCSSSPVIDKLRPWRSSIHTTMRFLTVSFFYFFIFLLFAQYAEEPSPEGENMHVTLVYCAWSVTLCLFLHGRVGVPMSKNDITANTSPLTVEIAVIKTCHSRSLHKLTLQSSTCLCSVGGKKKNFLGSVFFVFFLWQYLKSKHSNNY